MSERRRKTAATPEERENQLIAMAYDLAEEQIRTKTASAMVLTHFLKLATQKEQLEREILTEQRKLVTAKRESIDAARRNDTIYEEALKAMQTYSGTGIFDHDYPDL